MAKRSVVAVGVAAMFSLAGCGVVPAAPPVARRTVSTSMAPQSATSSGPTSPAVRGFSEFERAALRVRNIGCGSVARGSGFAISDHAFITNRHVIGGANLLQVSTFDGHDVQVTTDGAAVTADLAVVWTVERLPSTVPLAQSNPPIGAAVTAVGFPLGGQLTTSHGQVLGYDKDPIGESSLPMLRNDAPIEHGSSGSALLNEDGALVGVVYAGSRSGFGYAVPVEILKKILDEPSSLFQSASCDGALANSQTGQSASSGPTCGPTVVAGPKTGPSSCGPP